MDMGSISAEEKERKPHAVCIPFPAQGHINPMLKLAKLLHHRGFHITFINTQFNHRRLLKSRGSDSLKGLPDFHFHSIPDGLPPSDVMDATQNIPALCDSTSKTCLVPFHNLLCKLIATYGIPPITCIVSDGLMSFTLDAAEELGVPEVLLWTPSACGFLAYMHYHLLIERGLTPLKGFHITFVYTEYNHKRLLQSRGPDSLNGLPDFQFHTIPDGLPPSDIDATQDIPALSDSTSKTCLVPFRNLLSKLNTTDGIPPITCIVSDGCMSFTLDAAEELGVPEVLFWTPSACGYLAYMHYHLLIERGLTPLKDMSSLTNGYLDIPIDWIPGMKDIRLRDIPSFVRTTDPNDIMLNFLKREAGRSNKAAAIIVNSFDSLEKDVLNALSEMLPCVYSIGPLQLLLNQIQDDSLKSIGSNLWREEPECLQWLNSKKPSSVVYVNFGSITVMTSQQLIEFAWGLVNSEQMFLWIIRPDLVRGDSAVLPAEFLTRTKDRGLLASWCPQEQVLNHPAIGGFLTHSGWNSILETICGGVPVMNWPFFAEQQTNCRYSCVHWGIGGEIDNNVKREDVERLVRDLMVGDKAKEMKKKAMEWKKKAEEATAPGGSSHINFNNLVNQLLFSKPYKLSNV